MKANELMIGDWVKIRLWDRNEKIKAIYANGVVCNYQKDFDEIEPIPITPEILEKNGFEWDATHISQKLICGSVHICWGFYKNCLSMSDWDDNGDTQITSIRCEYVHQLQHALRLCRIEKEIEL